MAEMDIDRMMSGEETLESLLPSTQLLDALPDIVIVLDEQRNVLFANKAFDAACGISLETIVGRPYDGLFGESCRGELVQHLRQVLATGSVASCRAELITEKGILNVSLRATLLRGNGTARPLVLLHGTPRTEEDTVGGRLRELTALLERRDQELAASLIAEQKYRLLLERAAEAILVTDEDGCVLEANARTAELTGRSMEELVCMKVFDWVHPEDRSIYLQYNEVLKSKGFIHNAEIRILRKDGAVVHVECSSVALGPNRFQSILHNVTERRRRENELQQRNRHTVALYEIGRQIASSFDIDHVLTVIAKNTMWLLECHFAAVALCDAASERISYKAAVGCRNESIHCSSFTKEEGMWKYVVTAQAPVILKNFPYDPPVDVERFPVIAAEGLRSVLGVPLTCKHKVVGILVVGYRERHDFTEEVIELVSNLGDQAAIALENARLYQSSMEHLKALEALSSRLAAVQEEERRRIARDLHDGIGQALTGIRFNLDLLCREVPITSEPGLARVRSLKTMIDETFAEVRQMAFDIRPSVLDDFGLLPALRQYIARFREHSGIETILNVQEDIGRLDPGIEATLYRVVQEALTNVARHSHARQAEVRLTVNDSTLIFEISDAGEGFDMSSLTNDPAGAGWKGGLGILNMKERIADLKGTFDLRSEVGKGTRIHIEIPISH